MIVMIVGFLFISAFLENMSICEEEVFYSSTRHVPVGQSPIIASPQLIMSVHVGESGATGPSGQVVHY